MNKNELIKRISQKTGCKRSDVETILSTLDEMIVETLEKDEKITFQNFGTFEVRTRAAHAGRNPQNGDPIEIPEKKAVVFKSGKNLKDRVCRI